VGATHFGIKAKLTVIKVQLPVVTNNPEAVALVYDKEQKHYAEQPIDLKTRIAMKADLRAFFEGVWHNNVWVIGKRLPEQFW
jgi:hypothetical protein